MILAAGVGSRLAPITDSIPKPMIPVLGKPVLSRIIELLQKHGFNKYTANTHYLGQQIQEAFSQQIDIHHEEFLTGVAGGIRVCADFLKKENKPFAVIMGDALTNIDLSAMLESHIASGRQLTIAVKQVEDVSQFGVVCFDDTNKITSFQEKPKPQEAFSKWANTGVYIFNPSVLDYIPSLEEAPVYDAAKDLFPRLLKENIEMNVFLADAYWADLGTHDQYRQTLFDCLNGDLVAEIEGTKYSWGYLGDKTLMNPGCFIKGKAYIGKNCNIGRAILKGNVVIEDNCIIEDDVVLENCLVMNNSVIKKGSVVKNINIEPNKIYRSFEPAEVESNKIFNLLTEASKQVINVFKSNV